MEDDASSELQRLRKELMEQKSKLDAAYLHTEQLTQQLKSQDSELSTLRKQLEERDARLKAVSYDPDTFDDGAVQFYLGLKSKSTFDALYKNLHHKAARMRYWRGENVDYDQAKGFTGPKRLLTPKHEFAAVLIRLKLGLFVEDLSARLGISTAHFSSIFTTWIRLLRLELQDTCRFPSRFEVRHFMPVEAQKFSNLRCMIDCTEFFVEAPSSLVSQRRTWSSYKQNNTAKVLVACTPDGVLCYISPLYCGGSSDKFITVNCGFLDYLQPGDRVLADKGFDVKSEVEKRGASLNLPPFLHPGHKQFTEDEVEQTRQIAEVRIHVERLIGRIKSFHLLDGTMPLTLHPILEDIIHTCAYLTLFQAPICKADCPRPVDGQPVSGGCQESMLSGDTQAGTEQGLSDGEDGDRTWAEVVT